MKLTFKPQDNSYFTNKKVPFSGSSIPIADLKKVFDFSYEMCFGKGYHREYRSGGQHERKKGEMFCNTFQGKLAEIATYNYFLAKGLSCEELDFSISPQGIWDDVDILTKGKKISIKSVAFFSDLLLLETKDWNSSGKYIPNLKNDSTTNYDYFILVKIKPDIKKLFKSKNLYFSNEISKETIEQLILREQLWEYEVVGYCTDKTIEYIINHKYIIPQNSFLNGKTKIDAENYYIQSGDLKKIEILINELQTM